MALPALSDTVPSAWVNRFAPLIRPGPVLDLACGSGRHSRLLAALGLQVVAVDRDAAALKELSCAAIRPLCIDLEQEGAHDAMQVLQPEYFAGIVVTNYLHRPLLPYLFDSLVDGGVLIYETFARGNAAFGKPSNPAFLLEPNELLDAARNASCRVHIVAFENGFQSAPRPAMVQRLCAIRCVDMPSAQAMEL